MTKYGVKRAALFGSVARGEDTPESDVDILIELGSPMGLLSFSQFTREVETALQRKVDVITSNSINKFFRPYILPDVKTIYER